MYAADYHDLSNKLKKTVNEDKHSFQAGMKSTVTNIIDAQIVPWLHHCFIKYSPEDFHNRMSVIKDPITGKMIQARYDFDGVSYRGFDYIEDWRRHHKKIFITFKMAKRMQRYLELDGSKLYDTITNLLESKGYNLLPRERQCIRHTIAKVMRLIYT